MKHPGPILLLALALVCAPVLAQEPASFNLGVARSDYRLGPGDQIKVAVFGYEEYTGEQLVLPDGSITLPLLGRVIAAERTTEELVRELTERLNPYLKKPFVTVEIRTLRPVRITVAGEVYRPGPLQLRSFADNATGTPARAPTVSGAITEAGGVTREADIRQIVLRRFDPRGEGPALTLDLWEALWSPRTNRDLALQDGDTLYIPRLTAGAALDRKLIARSSLAPRTVRVRVVGEVKKPGEVEVLSNGSISSAVAIAGGPTDKADLSRVVFSRLNDEGRVDTRTLNLTDLADADQIQQGDVVIVPKHTASVALDIAGQLFAPFAGLSSLLNLFK